MDQNTTVQSEPSGDPEALNAYAGEATGASPPPVAAMPPPDSTANSPPPAANVTAGALPRAREFLTDVRRDDARECAPDLAAELANQYAYFARSGATATSNDDIMKPIDDKVLKTWFLAQGLDETAYDSFRWAAWLSGLGAPTATLLNNSFNYFLVAAITNATGMPWLSAGLALAANAAQGYTVALQQSAVKSFDDWVAASQGYTVNLDAGINHRLWPKNVSDELGETAKGMNSVAQKAHEQFSSLMGIDDDPALMPDAGGPDALPMGPAVSPAEMKRRLDDGKRWDEFAALSKAFDERKEDMFGLQEALYRTQGAHEMHERGHKHQWLWRTLRAPASTAVDFGRGLSDGQITAEKLTAEVMQGILRKNVISGNLSVGVQAIISLSIQAGQSLAAAYDERNRQEYYCKLNLAYGRFLTDAGVAKLKAGEKVTGDDVDMDKLRSYMNSSKQALTMLVQTVVVSYRKGAEAKRDALTAEIPARDAGEARTPSALEAGPEPAADPNEELELLETLIKDLKRQEQAIADRDGGLLEESDMATLLLEGLNNGGSWPLLREAVYAKYRKKGETSVQTAMRVGQSFHGIFLGSFAAGSIGKIVPAAYGGVEYTPTWMLGLVMSLGGIFGGTGAYFNPFNLNIKNFRRDQDEDTMGFSGQVRLGMQAMFLSWAASRSAGTASSEVKTALAQIAETERFVNLYKDAVALKAGETGSVAGGSKRRSADADRQSSESKRRRVDDQIENDAAMAAELQNAFNAEIPLEQQLAYFQLMQFKAMKQIWDAKGDPTMANSFAEKIAKVENDLDITTHKAPPKKLTDLGEREWLSDAHISTDQDLLCNVLRRDHPSLAERVQFVAPAVSCLVAVGDEKVAKEAVEQAGMEKAELLIVPINDANAKQIAMGGAGSHWSLLVIDRANPREPRAIHYDSLPSEEQRARAVQTARRLGFEGSVSPGKISKQTDTFSCGDYVVAATRKIVDRRVKGDTEPDRSDLSSVEADRPKMMERLKQQERPSGQ